MSAPRALPAVLAVALCGCVDIPSTYAPPVERKPVTGWPTRSPNVIGMGDPEAQAYIASGISDHVEAGAWRWAFKRAELRFILDGASNVKLVVDFTLPEANFRQTGPVSLSFFVNDVLLETVRYDQPGTKHFEKPVPAGLLRADAYTRLAIEVDKPYRAPQDGKLLGFILNRAGFL